MFWEKSLPFEYGYFYKLIEKPDEQDKNALANLQYTDNLKPSFSSSDSNGVNAYVENTYLELSHNFLPIGFIEKTQEIVLGIIVNENERISGFLNFNYNQMQKAELTKYSKRIGRVKILAPLFIRNFEKVL